jgi:hypothetical protein
MPHTDLHKTEAQLRAENKASKKTDTPKTPAKVPETVASSTTASEEQTIAQSGFKLETHLQSHSCHIYSRIFPNTGEVEAVKFRGAGGGGLCFTDRGQVILHTGDRNQKKGAGSGNLAVESKGSTILKANQGLSIECGLRDPYRDGALNVMATADSLVECLGTFTIKAKKIVLKADNIEFAGGDIQSIAGDGTYSVVAGQLEYLYTNKSETVFGQKRTIQIGEESKTELDPRGSTNNVQMGADNTATVGDQIIAAAGVAKIEVAGGPGQLIKDRSTALSIRVLLGNIDITAVAGNIASIATAGTNTVTAGAGAAALTAGAGPVTVTATGGVATMTGTLGAVISGLPGPTTITGSIINLN